MRGAFLSKIQSGDFGQMTYLVVILETISQRRQIRFYAKAQRSRPGHDQGNADKNQPDANPSRSRHLLPQNPCERTVIAIRLRLRIVKATLTSRSFKASV